MKKSTRNVLIGTGVVLLCPLPLLPVALAGIGGVLTYQGIKKVKKGYVSSVRQQFSKAGDPNRKYTFSGGSSYTKEQLEACKLHLGDVIKAGTFSNTGFIPRSVTSGVSQGLEISTVDPSTGRQVIIDRYDRYNPVTSCAEIRTRGFDQFVKAANGVSNRVRCDRVAVKLDREGKIDWSKKANRNLFKNPQAVGEVLRRYPESFATIPNDILHEALPGTSLSMGDYLQRTIKKEVVDRLNGTSEYTSIVPRREDGSPRSTYGYVTDLHAMMQNKINDYVSQYGSSTRFSTSASAWVSSSSTESYF